MGNFLQVHYADVSSFVNGNRDHSGISLEMVDGSSGVVKRRAGIYLLGTGGMLPAKRESKYFKPGRKTRLLSRKNHQSCFYS